MSFLDVAISAAKKGGAVVDRYFETSIEREVKADKSFVTAADKEAEAVIIAELKKHFPDHGFLGEESGETRSSSEYQWVIDPLDGTANFVNGIPMFAVSIALFLRGAPIVGVVYNPVTDSLYASEKGKGVTCNGANVSVSDGGAEHAMITFGPGKKEKLLLNALFSNAERLVKSKRYLGCAALDLAYVARGGTEGFVCLGLNTWDYAAGVLLVAEAGGKLTDFKGNPWFFGGSDHFLASNGHVHDALLALVKSGV